MKGTRWSFAVVACAWLAAADGSAQLGSPNDPFSCYSHCGETRLSGASVTCYCDMWCEARGDCCADMNAYCSVQAAAPHCALTNNSPGSSSEFGNFCGTDLGFVFQHGSTLNVLFGDSWQYKSGSSTTCEDRGVLPENDDSQATLPVARPNWVPTSPTPPGSSAVSCPTGTLNMQQAGGTFVPITLKDAANNPVTLGVGDTPLTGFSDGTNAWALFGVGGQSGGEAQRDVHVAFRQGAMTNYRTLVKLGLGNKFENPSAAVVTSLTNFDPPAGGGTLLLFGRPRFNSSPSQSANTNLVYLLRQSLPLNTAGGTPPAGTFNWSPQYFAGITNGVVNWQPSANAAVTLFPSDFKITNQLDVKWIPQLKKWIMLYGGSILDATGLNDASTDQPRHGAIHMRIADFPWGPWSPPAPALFRENMGPYYHCDANGATLPLGCDVFPWAPGTWSQGAGAAIPNCRSDAPQPWMPNYVIPPCIPPTYQQRGNMYSPNMIVSWTSDNGFEPISRRHGASLYFTTSTWTPYQVTLNVLDLRLFEQPTYNFGGVYVQLRDLTNGMVTRNSTTAISRSAGSTAVHAAAPTKFVMTWADSGAPPNRGPAIGDTVVLYNTSNATKLLGRNAAGNGLTYLDDTSPWPPAALWVLESTNTTGYPTGTPIHWGTTPLRLKSPSSSARLRSSPTGALSVSTATPDSNFVWNFNWACLSTDSCTPAQ